MKSLSELQNDLTEALGAVSKAERALAEYEVSRPPFGTIMAFDDSCGNTAYAIRLEFFCGTGGRLSSHSPGWLTIFCDGSGDFYSDSRGGLDKFHLHDGEEVYRP